MTRSRWIIFALLCLGILGFVVFTSKSNEVSFNGDAAKIINEGPIADHVAGSQSGKPILIEYGDLQCPACRSIFPTVKNLKSQYADELTFVYRNFPLTNIHPNALAAATAAEAAGLQDKFYEMHDALYVNQDEWSGASASERSTFFEKYARQIGLDLAKYKKDLTNPDVKAKIDRDRATAKTFGANSTPTFVLNGKKLPSETATSAEALMTAVEDAIKDAK